MDQQDNIYINGINARRLNYSKCSIGKKDKEFLKKLNNEPSLAEELRGSCASFTDLVHLDSAIIAQLFKVLKPEVIGLSLIGSSIELQKKVLSSAPRDLAEISYEIMSSPEPIKNKM